MSKERFIAEIYKPYLITWSIIKLLQNAYQHLDDPEQDAANDELWNKYMTECDKLKAEFPDSEFVEELLYFLIGGSDHRGVAEVIAKMNQEELK